MDLAYRQSSLGEAWPENQLLRRKGCSMLLGARGMDSARKIELDEPNLALIVLDMDKLAE